MKNLTFNANLNRKEVPARLYVHGSIMVYTPKDKVKIKKAVPQGINPTILILDLLIIESDSPKKGTPKGFKYVNSSSKAKRYKQVTLRLAGEEDKTVDVEIFG